MCNEIVHPMFVRSEGL